MFLMKSYPGKICFYYMCDKMYDNLSVLIDKFSIDQRHMFLIYKVQGPGCTGMGPGHGVNPID